MILKRWCDWILYKFGQDFRFSGLFLEFLIQWVWGAVWKSSTGPQLGGQEIWLTSLLWSSPWEKAVLILKENCVLYSSYISDLWLWHCCPPMTSVPKQLRLLRRRPSPSEVKVLWHYLWRSALLKTILDWSCWV